MGQKVTLVAFLSLVIASCSSSGNPLPGRLPLRQVYTEADFAVDTPSVFGNAVRVNLEEPIRYGRTLQHLDGAFDFALSGERLYFIYNRDFEFIKGDDPLSWWTVRQYFLRFRAFERSGFTRGSLLTVCGPGQKGKGTSGVRLAALPTGDVALMRYVCSEEEDPRTPAILVQISQSGGKTLGPPTLIWRSPEFGLGASDMISTSDGTLYILTLPEIRYLQFAPIIYRSGDLGRTWEGPFEVFPEIPREVSVWVGRLPQMAVDSAGNLYIAAIMTDFREMLEFPDTSDNSPSIWVYLFKSRDGGRTFQLINDRVNMDTRRFPANSDNASITIDELNHIYIAYGGPLGWESDGVGFKQAVFFTKSTDGGLTFSEPVNLYDLGYAVNRLEPVVKARNGKVYVLWADDFRTTARINVGCIDRDRSYLVARMSHDRGENFGPVLFVSPVMAENVHQTATNPPRVIIDGEGVLHIMWNETRYVFKKELCEPFVGGESDLFYLRAAL